MDKLIQFVITHGNINLVALSDMLNLLDGDMAQRFAMAVFGIDDYHLPEGFPETVVHDGKVLTFKSYNYLKDRVECTYEIQITRWYKDAESVEKNRYDYKSSKCEGFDYESVRTETRYDSWSLDQWMKFANNSENN